MSGVRFTVDFSQVQALARRLQVDAMPAMAAEMETAMTRVVLKGERVAKQHAKRDTGENRRRITSTVIRESDGVTGIVGTNNPYAPPVEEGRKPGSKMPPKGSLIAWMKRHGMDPKREFVLRRAIARRGIPGDHNLQNTVMSLEPDVRREFAQVGPRVIQRLVKGA